MIMKFWHLKEIILLFIGKSVDFINDSFWHVFYVKQIKKDIYILQLCVSLFPYSNYFSHGLPKQLEFNKRMSYNIIWKKKKHKRVKNTVLIYQDGIKCTTIMMVEVCTEPDDKSRKTQTQH